MPASPPPADRAGRGARAVTRHRQGAVSRTLAEVAEETPVALVVNGISHVVMMATPADLELWALGFALGEGIVDRPSEVLDTEVQRVDGGIEVRLTVPQRVFAALKDRRRALAGRTGCGVCGVESIALLDLNPPRIEHAGAADDIGAGAVERAVRELPLRQPLMRETGGVHAAAWCSRDGEIVDAFEDVGRHNALDKLIGRLARRGTDPRSGFVFLSSRASYELVRKAARIHIPMLATISAPTSLAIAVAQQAGIRLLGFCRDDGFVEYVRPEREPALHPASSAA